jgi:flavin-dependent dehydrogenase
MLLARKGYRTLLVDRAKFPSDVISTHLIWQTGAACLKRWNLLTRVAASNCPLISQVTFDFGDFALKGLAPPADGVGECYAPRRKVLDKILLDAAVDAGAELREGFTVEEIVTQDDKAIGIRGHDRGGSQVVDKTRIVIGADGTHSIVARCMAVAQFNVRPALTCWYYSYWSGVPIDGPQLYSRPYRAMGGPPTNDGLTLVAVGWTNKEFHQFRSDIEGNFLKTLELAPAYADRVRCGKREERFVGTADLPNFFRKRHGPGWALVGDAAYHKDPITARGISDAFCDAELLSEAIDAGFSGRKSLQQSLDEYERRRNEEVSAMYDFTCDFASLAPPSEETRSLLAAISKEQLEANRYLGTIAGSPRSRSGSIPGRPETTTSIGRRGLVSYFPAPL